VQALRSATGPVVSIPPATAGSANAGVSAPSRSRKELATRVAVRDPALGVLIDKLAPVDRTELRSLLGVDQPGERFAYRGTGRKLCDDQLDGVQSSPLAGGPARVLQAEAPAICQGGGARDKCASAYAAAAKGYRVTPNLIAETSRGDEDGELVALEGPLESDFVQARAEGAYVVVRLLSPEAEPLLEIGRVPLPGQDCGAPNGPHCGPLRAAVAQDVALSPDQRFLMVAMVLFLTDPCNPYLATAVAGRIPDRLRPSILTQCERAQGLGSWQPTAEQMLAAIRRLPDVCFTPWESVKSCSGLDQPTLLDAFESCSTKMSSTSVGLTLGLGACSPPACQLTVTPVQWQERRWIVVRHFVPGWVLGGSQTDTVELVAGELRPYFRGNQAFALCQPSSDEKVQPTTKPVVSEQARADLPSMPAEVRRRLCGFVTEAP